MLASLYVENLALIERLELELGPGFNVLTGETGAGKSLVVDAVNLLLGARAATELIRTGAERAAVQGAFFCPGSETLRVRLEEMGVVPEPGEVLVLARELNRTGRHLCRVGGRLVGLAAYQELGRCLVDVHGQHEHQSLLNGSTQLWLLDAYGGPELLARRRAVGDAWRRWQRAEAERARLAHLQEEEQRYRELWEFQVREIRSARLRPQEEEELQAREKLLAGAESLLGAVEEAYRLLFGGPGGTGAYDQISRAAGQIRAVIGLDPAALSEVVGALEEVAAGIQDHARFLRDYREGLDFSAEHLAEVQARLAQIRQLRRKYGGTVEEILKQAEELERRLKEMSDRSEELARAETERAAAEADYRHKSSELSAHRREAAKRLEAELAGVLVDLALPNTVFVVNFTAAAPGPAGEEAVEFHFSSNPGEPPRPVAKVASGGELSRLMLGLKSIMAENDAIPTLIFDEVDAGLGGAAARAVGEKLRQLSRWHQVICVTHAPQIAAYADRHFFIAKEEAGGRTVVRVRELGREERIGELARMLAGRVDDASLNHARRLLEEAGA
ncbi:MAG: DNA repair protein RecN [Clostridia bacterium]|jgi:DNA repair protein RecN (Recombination protein N)|nr:DNA repair protein RecN [Clostridia bacterium]MDH7572677.1 DNA repair protein RecN [Clostridia bacterium]